MKAKNNTWISILSVFLLAAVITGNAQAGHPPPDKVELEPSYYNDEVYLLAIPSAISANSNQAEFACFNLGPDLTDQSTGPYGILYVILAPGATQVGCPDGSLRHDHVLSSVPESAGYVPRWRIILATPGIAFDQALMPFTSIAEVGAAVAANQLELTDTEIIFIAPVIGQAGR